MQTNFDGTVVTGTFTLDLATDEETYNSAEADNSFSIFTAGAATVSFHSVAGDYTFPNTPYDSNEVFLDDTGTSQSVGVGFGFDPYYFAGLSFAGSEGSLFSDLDPTTLQASRFSSASANFFASRQVGAEIDISSITLGGITSTFAPPTPVPLSASWVFLLLGVVSLGVIGALRGGPLSS